MVTFKYKGNRTKFVRTDGGRVIAFGSGSVHELDENDKRSKELVKKMLAFPEDFEVVSRVGQKTGGGGLKTHIRPPKRLGRPDKSREHLGKGEQAIKKEVKCPKGSYKCKGVCKCDTVKKPRGLRRPKGKSK